MSSPGQGFPPLASGFSIGPSSSSPSDRVTELARRLTKLIVEEFDRNRTCTRYTRAYARQGLAPVTIKSTQFSLTPEHRERANELGQKCGCHTCGTRIENDPDQPWIGDHSYPTNLTPRVLGILIADTRRPYFEERAVRYLFPQCHRCSADQAGWVKYLNGLSARQIQDILNNKGDRQTLYRLLHGTWPPVKDVNCLISTSPNVSEAEGARIQEWGIALGCHSDSRHRVPVARYIADHIFPQEFCTGYMRKVLDNLGLGKKIPESYELRPQCARCSSHQGGKMTMIARLAQEYASLVGITVYKGLGGVKSRFTSFQTDTSRGVRIAQAEMKRKNERAIAIAARRRARGGGDDG